MILELDLCCILSTVFSLTHWVLTFRRYGLIIAWVKDMKNQTKDFFMGMNQSPGIFNSEKVFAHGTLSVVHILLTAQRQYSPSDNLRVRSHQGHCPSGKQLTDCRFVFMPPLPPPLPFNLIFNIQILDVSDIFSIGRVTPLEIRLWGQLMALSCYGLGFTGNTIIK